MTQIRLAVPASIFAVALLLCGLPSHATTKGLNQIVTPDIQPAGALSLSFQQIDPSVGNRDEFQTELGITNNFEIAVFQGTSPSEQIGNAELGLVDHGPLLLSTGFLNWTTKGTAPQPFLEGGYYEGATELIAGAVNVVEQEPGAKGSIRSVHSTQAVFGVAYRLTPRVQLMTDYQSGAGNAATAGLTYSITPNLTFNPAIYISNSEPTKGYGYAVLTWTIQAFAPKNSTARTQPAAPATSSPNATPTHASS